MQKARSEYEAFESHLYETHPELRIHRGDAEPLRVEQADALLTDTRTAVLEFVVNRDKTLLFVLTKGAQLDIEVFDLAIGESELTERIEQFRRLLANADNRFSGALPTSTGCCFSPQKRYYPAKGDLSSCQMALFGRCRCRLCGIHKGNTCSTHTRCFTSLR